MELTYVSLTANLLITGTITFLLLSNAESMTAVYGPDTPARRILACVYAAIGLASLVGLCSDFVGQGAALVVNMVWVLFPLQIAYKLATLPLLGMGNPVAVSNLLVVILHSAALVSLQAQAVPV